MADQDAQSIIAADSAEQNTKADAWDVFHNSANMEDFEHHLSGLNLSKETKAKLWDLKQHSPDQGALNQNKSDPGDEPWTIMGVAKGLARSAKDVAEGAGSGIISTGLGAYNLARKGVSAAGLGQLPEAPDFVKKAAAPVQYDAQGNPIDSSTSFGVGRTGEQAAEFLVPEMKAGKLVDAANIGSKVLKIGARAASDAAVGGGVSAVQSGGDLEKAGETAITSGIMSGAFNTIGGILSSIPASSVYLKNLKFPTRFASDRVEDIVGTAIDDGILISKGGAKKAEAFENMSRAARDAEIAKHAGEMVDINIVRAPVLRLKQMADELGETKISNQISKRLQAFEEANGAQAAVPPSTTTSPVLGPTGQSITSTTPGTPAKPAQITIKAAQQAKDDFNLLAQNMFGKFSPGAGEIRKLMGAGLKNAIEAVSPEVKQLNYNTQNYKLLKNAINKYIDSNPELIDPRTAVLFLWNKPRALLYGALSNPFIRSALAIAKDRVEGSAVPAIGQGIQRTAGAMPTLAQQGPNQ